MNKQTLLKAASILLLGAGLLATSCARAYVGNDTDINTAVKMDVVATSATSATLSLSPTQEVSGFILAGPVPASEYNYNEGDAIANLAWIEENGVDAEFPYLLQNVSPLNADTEYLCGFVAKDANGVICSAPAFKKFKTGYAAATVNLSMPTPGVYSFDYSILMNDNTKSVKWIVSTDKSVTELDNAALKAYTLKNGKVATADVIGNISSATKANCVIAAIAYDDLDREGKFSSNMISSETVVKVNIGAKSTKLSAVAEGVECFKGTVDIPASGDFTINVNGVEYGFTSYSGGGGVGTVNNMKSALPYYSLTADMTYKFYIEKAFGQMTPIENGGNAFWINMKAAGKLDVTVDMTNEDGIYRYRFEVPQTDPSIVFYEGFDLCVWGGFFQAPVTGTIPETGSTATWDGSEPGTAKKAKTTDTGLNNFCYPTDIPLDGTEVHASETLMKNLGLDKWSFKKATTAAGHLRICSSATNCYTSIYTPKFTALTGPTKLTVTMECWNFAADYDGNLHFDVVGAGKYTAAKITNTAGYNETMTMDGTRFTITTAMVPKHANGDVNKTITKFVFTVEGATADTRIRFGNIEQPIASTKNSRICLDYIKVTK